MLSEQQRLYTPVSVSMLSVVFAEEYARHTTEAQRREVDARNAAEPQDSGVCHSHDFCDANQVMLDALELIYGAPVEFDPTDDELNQLMTDAWNCVKSRGFSDVDTGKYADDDV